MKDNPTPPEKDGLEKLIELMGENNRATSEIERDGRNTRRHLLEMKKIQQASLDMSDRVNTGFENFFETMNANKLGDKETANERDSIFEEIRDELKEMRSSGIPQNGKSGGGDGVLTGAGKLFGGIGSAGIGVGAAAAGIAAVFASSAFLLDKLEDMDAKKIVANVVELVSLNDALGGKGEALKEGGTLALVLGGIGLGLLAFSAGAGAGALVQGAIEKFEGDGWVDKIKDNITNLLSIADLPGLTVENVAGVGVTLGALGLGLLAFSAGSATGVAVTGADEAIKKFSGNGGFAKSIKENVETLLSTDTSKGSGLKIAGTMAALSAGLIAFSAGSVTATAADGAASAIEKFSDSGNWAEKIVSNVETLLGISSLSFLDATATSAALGTLGAGLLAFAVGGGANVAVGGVDEGVKYFSETGWAEQVVKNVTTLTKIGEDSDNLTKAATAAGTLGTLGVGLAAFGTGSWIASLGTASQALVNFFVGGKSPVEQALLIGEKSKEIDKGTEAFKKFGDVLNNFETMAKVNFDADKFTQDLTKAARTLELVIKGGTSDSWMPFDEVTYAGLANITDDVDAAVASITRLQGAFNMSAGGVDVSADRQSMGVELMNVSAENVELRMANNQPQSGNVTAVRTDNSTNRGGDSYSMAPPKPSKTKEATASR
jgi:hypothetical protein